MTSSVGPDNEMVSLWSSADDHDRLVARETLPNGVSFPATRPVGPAAAGATIDGSAGRRVIVIPDVPVANGAVQSLPDGELLLVGARARWRQSEPDRNAVVVDADGVVVREATIGDGVSSVLTAVSGAVWVGYFDEGIYGNFGWGSGDGPEPIGQSGLVRFGSDLRLDWEFPSRRGAAWGAIDDCYALNLDGDTAWTCYYADFPLVRIMDDVVRAWSNPVTGAGTILVGDDDIVFYGGYRSGPRLVHARLGTDAVEVVAEHQLTLPTGEDVPDRVDVISRGPDLHVVVGDDWYRLGLEDVVGHE